MLHQVKSLNLEKMSEEEKEAHFHGYSKVKRLQELGSTETFSEHFKYGWILMVLASHVKGSDSEFFQ